MKGCDKEMAGYSGVSPKHWQNWREMVEFARSKYTPDDIPAGYSRVVEKILSEMQTADRACAAITLRELYKGILNGSARIMILEKLQALGLPQIYSDLDRECNLLTHGRGAEKVVFDDSHLIEAEEEEREKLLAEKRSKRNQLEFLGWATFGLMPATAFWSTGKYVTGIVVFCLFLVLVRLGQKITAD